MEARKRCRIMPLSWSVLRYVHRNRRLIRDGSPGRPPRLSHSSCARIDVILVNAWNAVAQILLVCRFIDSVWSRCTPSYVTVFWKRLLIPPIYLRTCRWPNWNALMNLQASSLFLCVKLLFVALCPWVLFSQVWMLDRAEVKSLDGALPNIRVLSAYIL